jgi:predicted outer membrane lipoprotein
MRWFFYYVFVAVAEDSTLYNVKFMRLRNICAFVIISCLEYSKMDANDNTREKVAKETEDTGMYYFYLVIIVPTDNHKYRSPFYNTGIPRYTRSYFTCF